jgi:hypothetical protein
MAITLNGSGSITGLSSGAGISASALSGVLPDANAPSGSVIQVVSTTKTNVFFLAGGETFTDVTGFSASITPSSSSSRIFISVTSSASFSEQDSFGFLQIVRNSTAIAIGDGRVNASRVGMNLSQQTAGTTSVWSLPSAQVFVDSPATTSTVTYKVQAWCRSGRNMCVGGSYGSDDAYRASAPSTITLMEIA